MCVCVCVCVYISFKVTFYTFFSLKLPFILLKVNSITNNLGYPTRT